MSGDVTLGFLGRLSEGTDGVLAGQKKWDVDITGGSIANVTLTDVTVNGTATARTERVVTASGAITIASDDYVVTVNKTANETTSVTLPATPSTSRSLIIKDGKGNAGAYNITIDGNGKTIDGAASLVITSDFKSVEIIYNGAEWNVLNAYDQGGNVTGAVSSTDNAVVRFDGTSGSVLNNSGVIIDDTNNVSGVSNLTVNGTTTLATSLTGGLEATSGVVSAFTLTTAGKAILDDATSSDQRTTLGLAIGTNVQAYDDTLQSLSSLGTAADKFAYTTGIDTWAEGTITAAGRAILDDATAADQRTTLGLGTLSTQNGTFSGTSSGTNTGDETTTSIGTLINGATEKTTPVDADMVGLMDSAASNVLKKLSWANIKATAKTYFDTLYQPVDATLTALAGITTGANKVPVLTGTDTASTIDLTASTLAGMGSTGNATAISLGSGLSMSGAVLSASGGGKIAQVVQSHSITEAEQTSASASYVDITGLSASITPSATTSRVRVTILFGVAAPYNGATTAIKVLRDATGIWEEALAFRGTNTGGSGTHDFISRQCISYIDSPSTTSATTYKAQFERFNGAGNAVILGNPSPRTIILEEILA